MEEIVSGIYRIDVLDKAKYIPSIEDDSKVEGLVIDSRALESLEGIQRFDHLKYLHISEISIQKFSLKPLEILAPHIKALYLGGERKDIEILSSFDQLVSLTLRSTNLRGLSLLKDIKTLRLLRLLGGSIRDFSPLNTLNVEYLEFWNSRGLTDVSLISELSKLKLLFIQRCSNLSGIAGLKNSPLEILELDTLRRLTSLRGIENLPNIKKLLVMTCHLPPDEILRVANIRSLEEVFFWHIKGIRRKHLDDLTAKFRFKVHGWYPSLEDRLEMRRELLGRHAAKYGDDIYWFC